MPKNVTQKGGVREKTGSPRPSFLKRYPLVAYFVLAYLITWVGVSPLVVSAQGLLDIQASPTLHVIGGLGPILAAFIVTYVTAGGAGIEEFLSRLFRWRVGILWALIAVFSPVTLFALAAVVGRITGAPWPDFRQLSIAFADAGWVTNLLISSIAYGLGEEPGWRGFALPRLQKNRSALSATLMLALFWALWHLPFFFYKFEFQDAFSIFGFFMSMFAGALWLSFLYNSTGGSILMVALWHVVWNIVSLAGPVVSESATFITNLLIIVVAVLVLIIGGAARLSLSDKHTLEASGR